ncbi:MAG: polysaccharide biosynthesis protein, partial [Oscillospiraceae bacterium]|nr:polysaccharide biosynthesis protein [Oscillospiraceae bacterium]
TDNKLIHIGAPIPFDNDPFLRALDSLMHAAYENRTDIRERVQAIVPTYHPLTNGEVKKDKTYSRLVGEKK